MTKNTKTLLYSTFTLVIGALLVCLFLRYITIADFTAEEKYDDVSIPYSTEYVDDNELESGTQEVKRAGVNGTRRDYWKMINVIGVSSLTEEPSIRSKKITRSEIIEQPVSEIIHRGTRKWQYMICSDGGYQYYTDDDFTRLGLGFTHASPDFCAQKGKGAMVGLADTPPAKNQSQNSSNSHSYSYDDFVRMYGDPYATNHDYSSWFSNNTSSPNLTTLQPGYGSNSNNSTETSMDRSTANNICQSKASTAYQSILRQLGAAGANGSSVEAQAQEVLNSTYRNCMSQYGF